MQFTKKKGGRAYIRIYNFFKKQEGKRKGKERVKGKRTSERKGKSEEVKRKERFKK